MTNLVNLTPHDLNFYDQTGTKQLACISKSNTICRMNQASQKQLPDVVIEGGQRLPLIEAPEYTTIIGLPEDSRLAICVSMPVGQHLKANPHLYAGAVYGLDSSPNGSVRNEAGTVIGTKNLVLYKEDNTMKNVKN